ncbi:hypothetical protein Dimus_026639 [Dionaea muscipula]
MKEGVTRPRPKRLRKKHVISPAVGDNLLEIEEASEEEEEEEETLVARSRRVLPKTTFDGARGVDEEETDSDEVIGKGERIKRRRQKQESRTGPSKRPRKSKSPAKNVLPSDSEAVREDEDKEEVRFQIGNSSPTAEKLDNEIDKILTQALQHPFILESLITLDALVQEQIAENPSDRASGSDVATGTGDEKEEDKRRLTIPHSKMVARYAVILLGSSSRGARRYLSSLPPSHELALVMRNVAENDRLNNELTSKKARLTELATAAMQLKADVARVMNEKQTVEEENRRLMAELEKEKAKGKRSRERLVLLHNDLSDMSLKNERLHNTLMRHLGS